MHKSFLRIVIVSIAVFMNTDSALASDYKGGFFGGKFGINNSRAVGTINAPSASTLAYGVQGGYLQGGYNWDVSSAILGVGGYADFNTDEKHANKVEYGSRAYGIDAKLGLPADDWLFYAKIGYGYNTGTRDFHAVARNGFNTAAGVEYIFARRWGAIIEYKIDKFSSRDGSTMIKNNTFAFGLNYYFDRPEVAPIINVAVPDLGPEPEPEPELDTEPPPDIGSSKGTSASIGSSANASVGTKVTLEPATWKDLLDGKAVRIEGANFVSGTSKLMSVISKEINDTADFADKHPDVNLEVVGYSDDSSKKSRRLSMERAQAVRTYLILKGIPAKRISVKNKGPADPIGDNQTEEGRAKNRRVEIRSVLKKEKKAGVVGAAVKPVATTAPTTAPPAKPAAVPTPAVVPTPAPAVVPSPVPAPKPASVPTPAPPATSVPDQSSDLDPDMPPP
jgi:outer membrane protein OmpA-like peptidoglycan-associated protein